MSERLEEAQQDQTAMYSQTLHEQTLQETSPAELFPNSGGPVHHGEAGSNSLSSTKRRA